MRLRPSRLPVRPVIALAALAAGKPVVDVAGGEANETAEPS